MGKTDRNSQGDIEMTINKNADELLKRYLAAAGKSLPIKERADICRDIESMVLDVCEERWSDAEIDSRKMESVLVELGNPSALAAKYKTEVPLIGPELKPIFKLVLMIVCTVTAVISLISFFLGSSLPSAGESTVYFMGLASSLFGSVGFIFVIFVILERIIPDKKEFNPTDVTWNINDLPELKEKIPSKAEIIAGLIFSCIAIVALIFFVDYIGIYRSGSDGNAFYPVLAPAILSLIPLFCLRIAIGAVTLLPFVINRSMELSRGGSYYYNISQMGLELFDIGIIILLLTRGVSSFLLLEGFREAGFETAAGFAEPIFKGVLLLLLALSAFSLIKRTLVILPKRHV